MPSATKHIIGRQTLEMHFESAAEGYGLQNHVADVFYEKLLPAVAQLFDEVGGDQYVVSLESLSVDCGVLPESNWEHVWVEQAVKLIREKLMASRQIISPGTTEHRKLQGDVIFFIQHGYLPWDAVGSNRKSFETILFDTPFLNTVKQCVREVTGAADRLVFILPERKVKEIIIQLTNDSTMPAADTVQDIALSVSKANRKGHADVIRNAIINTQPPHTGTGINQPEKVPSSKSTTAGATLPEGIYISNAGLILLHPFLPPLFAACGLIVSGQWRDENAQHEAIALLEYLTFGDDDVNINQSLAQLLCGLAVDDVAYHDAITKEMRQECDTLLTAVIAHWSALKNTGVEALRNTFLKRKGKLTPTTQGWLLQVEQNAVDILLGRLPWGYGTVKLSWMKTLIHTEWI